jgi:hypothetical protein
MPCLTKFDYISLVLESNPMTTVPIRPSSNYLIISLLLLLLFIMSLLDANLVNKADQQRRGRIHLVVKRLGLTDPALFTEARYTRHLSQADTHAPFQDHPMAFEHFPSGSLALPADTGHRP